MPEPKRKQNRTFVLVLGLFVLGLLTLLVLLQSSNLWKSFTVETASDTLILYGLSSLNVAAFIIFGFIFLRSLVKLMRERRALQLGSKIKSRLLFFFALVSLLPIVAMAVFSYLFLNRAIDRWFAQIPEDVVRQAKEVQNRSNAEQAQRVRDMTHLLAASLAGRNIDEAELDRLREAGGFAYLGVMDSNDRIVVRAQTPSLGLDERALIERASFENPASSDGVDIAVSDLGGGRRLIASPNRQETESISQMVDGSLAELERLKQRQITVRQIGFLTLGVLTFLLIFASSWAAFHIARGITVPIKALAEGAERIALGDLGHQVDVLAEDELALLIWTFNEMSSKLEANAAELSERRRYIETILWSLPTGVISVNSEDRIGTMNPAAKSILRLGPGDFSGLKLSKIVDEADLPVIERLIARARRIGHASDQSKFSASAGNGSEGVTVAVSVTALPENRGVVIVIEDLSELIAAQRASAWQEVARRMAHEIKNPLTPIQLSAERIAKRFAFQPAAVGGSIGTGDDRDAQVVSEGTETILREVQSLKSMVDEFSRFARLPNVRLELWDVNEVIRQAAALYRERADEVAITTKLAENLPPSMIDDEQLKRVFVNLIDNAIEASGGGAVRNVSIQSRYDLARELTVVEVVDDGKGIDPADYPKLFQPYFSTKGRGTGLGLAIVSRIIAEHNGKIKAAPNQPRGAKFVIEFPVSSIGA